MKPMLEKLARILGDDPRLAFDLYTSASEIVDDFDDSRWIYLGDRDEETGELTPLGRLRIARDRVIGLLSERD